MGGDKEKKAKKKKDMKKRKEEKQERISNTAEKGRVCVRKFSEK